jgi:molecular chaperone GrpE
VLGGWGVERLGRHGEPFDPEVHDAVSYEDRPGAADILVSRVERAGYRRGPVLIRAAQVGVVGPPPTGRAPLAGAPGAAAGGAPPR